MKPKIYIYGGGEEMNLCANCGKPICGGYLCSECEKKEEELLDIKRRGEFLDDWFCHLDIDEKEYIKSNYRLYKE
jgi:hypothetical protein